MQEHLCQTYRRCYTNMIINLKSKYLFLYFTFSLFFMELLLNVSTSEGLYYEGFIFPLIFSMVFGAILYFLCTFFSYKVNFILSYILLALSGTAFFSQMLYYKFFKTFYSLRSAGNASQILEFWRDILSMIINNWMWIILFFLPVIFILGFGKKVFLFDKIGKLPRIKMACSIVFLYLIGIVSIYFNGREQYSAYDLYFNNSYSILSVKKLGLITTMRLDLQRTLFNWSSSLKEPVHDLPTPASPKIVQNKKVEYNTLNINFNQLISKEKNNTIKSMHKYFENVQPTSKNKFTGRYKGYNLILITAEGFSPYAVRKDVTPTLYKMAHEGFNFKNFYNPIWGVSTSDGEYVACTGLIPKSGVWSFYESSKISMPYVMGNQLKSLGYKTLAYHNHTYTYYKRNFSHPNMGYTYKGLGNGLNVKKTWPESDLEMMQKTVPTYISTQPFHIYYMTVSGHMRYSFSGNQMAYKNRKYVETLPYSNTCKAYIACQIELDKAMEYLLNQLEKAGIADKTLIAISADHYPYGLEDKAIDELAGHKVEKNFELYKSTFILYSKGMKPTTIDKPCSSLDIIPTLSNLLGLKYDSRLLMGQDIFSNSQPLVIFENRSFITDKGHYNAKTKEFIANKGTSVDKTYIKTISQIVNNKFYYSAKILETNYYKSIK